MGAEEAGIEKLHERPEIADVIFHGCAGEGDAIIGRDGAGRAGLFRLGVLDVLGLVENNAGPRYFLEQLKIAVQQGVTRQHQGMFAGLFAEGPALLPIQAVVDHHGQIGREPLGFLLPVADDGHGANEQRRASGSFAIARGLTPPARLTIGPVAPDEGQGLHGFAEPHVVGETGAKAPAAQEAEPGIAALLIGPQRAAKLGRRRKFREPGVIFELVQEVADPAVGRESAERQVARHLGLAQGHAHQIADFGSIAAVRLPEVEGGLNLVAAELDPLASHLDQRLLEPGEHLQFFNGQ